MYLRMGFLGVLVLAGCTGSTPEAPKATAPTGTTVQGEAAGRAYTISVPNMT